MDNQESKNRLRSSARSGAAFPPVKSKRSGGLLSMRQQGYLSRLRRQLAGLAQQVRQRDRLLTGSLAACSIAAQAEMLAELLEAVQELRVELQRIESCMAPCSIRGHINSG